MTRRRLTDRQMKQAASIAVESGLRVKIGPDRSVSFEPIREGDDAPAPDEAAELEAKMAERMGGKAAAR